MRHALAPLFLPLALVACQQVESPPASPAPTEEFFTAEDYARLDKIDLHAHIHGEDGEFIQRTREDRFWFVNIAVHDADPDLMRMRHETVFTQLETHPDRVIAVSSFPMKGWDDDDWHDKTIRYLDETFARGAVGVKVWKNIGMDFRDKNGDMVMIDNPRFDPIFQHLVQKGIPVIGHLGEPRECWLPVEEMVMHKGYFSSHPEYHMFLHPEMPSYEDQLAARDGLLERNPRIQFSGAHLGSLEWSVDELAAFLERFPNVIVDTAARVRDLQYQSSLYHDKVRGFMIKYQDRVAYGTDLTVEPTDPTGEAIEAARHRWHSDWTYFATDGEVELSQLNEPVKGLKLPKSVVLKLYRTNAERFFNDPWGTSSS